MKDKTVIDISKQDESLRSSASKYYYSKEYQQPVPHFINHFCSGAEFGANWQKEKDKAIQDKLMRVVRTCNIYFQNEANYPEGTTGDEIHKECKQLLKEMESIEQ